MPKIDDYENEVLAAFDQGKLKSVASKAELAKFKATALKDRRVNIRLSSGDLSDSRREHSKKACPTRRSSPASCTSM